MKINITFIIQIINFFITYKVLNIFLFKPVIASLEAKRAKQKALEKSITKEEEVLLSLEKTKAADVVAFQGKVKEEYPFISLVQEDSFLDITKIKTETIDTKNLESEVTQWLIEKVPHGF